MDLMPKSWMPNSPIPKGTECRNPVCQIGLNAEILNAELDWRPNGTEGRIFECRMGLNAEILNAALDWRPSGTEHRNFDYSIKEKMNTECFKNLFFFIYLLVLQVRPTTLYYFVQYCTNIQYTADLIIPPLFFKTEKSKKKLLDLTFPQWIPNA